MSTFLYLIMKKRVGEIIQGNGSLEKFWKFDSYDLWSNLLEISEIFGSIYSYSRTIRKYKGTSPFIFGTAWHVIIICLNNYLQNYNNNNDNNHNIENMVGIKFVGVCLFSQVSHINLSWKHRVWEVIVNIIGTQENNRIFQTILEFVFFCNWE